MFLSLLLELQVYLSILRIKIAAPSRINPSIDAINGSLLIRIPAEATAQLATLNPDGSYASQPSPIVTKMQIDSALEDLRSTISADISSQISTAMSSLQVYVDEQVSASTTKGADDLAGTVSQLTASMDARLLLKTGVDLALNYNICEAATSLLVPLFCCDLDVADSRDVPFVQEIVSQMVTGSSNALKQVLQRVLKFHSYRLLLNIPNVL
jgi:hypothetical protein